MRSTLTLVAMVALTVPLVAQNVSPIRDVQPVAYEAASVKPHDNATGAAYASILRSRPGQYQVVNTTFTGLLQSVYGVRPCQLEGAPDWASKEKWELQFTAPGTTMRDQS